MAGERKGVEEGEERREHGAKPCNKDKKSEGGGISGAVIDASIGVFFVSLHC